MSITDSSGALFVFLPLEQILQIPGNALLKSSGTRRVGLILFWASNYTLLPRFIYMII